MFAHHLLHQQVGFVRARASVVWLDVRCNAEGVVGIVRLLLLLIPLPLFHLVEWMVEWIKRPAFNRASSIQSTAHIHDLQSLVTCTNLRGLLHLLHALSHTYMSKSTLCSLTEERRMFLTPPRTQSNIAFLAHTHTHTYIHAYIQQKPHLVFDVGGLLQALDQAFLVQRPPPIC